MRSNFPRLLEAGQGLVDPGQESDVSLADGDIAASLVECGQFRHPFDMEVVEEVALDPDVPGERIDLAPEQHPGALEHIGDDHEVGLGVDRLEIGARQTAGGDPDPRIADGAGRELVRLVGADEQTVSDRKGRLREVVGPFALGGAAEECEGIAFACQKLVLRLHPVHQADVHRLVEDAADRQDQLDIRSLAFAVLDELVGGPAAIAEEDQRLLGKGHCGRQRQGEHRQHETNPNGRPNRGCCLRHRHPWLSRTYAPPGAHRFQPQGVRAEWAGWPRPPCLRSARPLRRSVVRMKSRKSPYFLWVRSLAKRESRENRYLLLPGSVALGGGVLASRRRRVYGPRP